MTDPNPTAGPTWTDLRRIARTAVLDRLGDLAADQMGHGELLDSLLDSEGMLDGLDEDKQEALIGELAAEIREIRDLLAGALGAETCDPAFSDNGTLFLACVGDDRADSEHPTPIRTVEAGDRWSELAAAVAAHRCGAQAPVIADQPPPTGGTGPSIHDLVVADLGDRKQVGLERYGTLLQAHNGRDALVDLYQELLDACCYARQAIAERDTAGGAR